MKPVFEQIYFNKSQSLKMYEVNMPYFNAPLHFHPEVEIVLILESFGKRFVGESVELFKEGDLVLIGPEVPHVWLNDKSFMNKNNKSKARALVMHFNLNIFGSLLNNCYELARVSSIIEESKYGIVIKDSQKEIISKRLFEIAGHEGAKRITKLIELLEFIEEGKEYRLLNKDKIINKALIEKNKSFTSLHQYLLNNYTREINISQIAGFMDMSVSSFCRYFKKTAHITFTQYINQLRIDYACKLLIDNSYSISQICFETGFNNLSYFNRTFKAIMNKTPKEYRKDFSMLEKSLS